ASITDGFDVFVQLVIAAITTLPCCSAWPFVETCSWTFVSSTPTAVGLPPSCSQRLTLNEASAGTATAALAFGLIREGNAFANDSPASTARLYPAGASVRQDSIRRWQDQDSAVRSIRLRACWRRERVPARARRLRPARSAPHCDQ